MEACTPARLAAEQPVVSDAHAGLKRRSHRCSAALGSAAPCTSCARRSGTCANTSKGMGRRAVAPDLQRRRLPRRLLARRRRARAATHTAAESRGAARRRRGGSAHLLRLPDHAPAEAARPTRSNASTAKSDAAPTSSGGASAVVGEDAATSATAGSDPQRYKKDNTREEAKELTAA